MTPCPACGHPSLDVFHEQQGVPTNSCLLFESRAEALAYPRGQLRLALCGACGVISNVAFDAALAEYSSRYEETQAYSPRFVRFAQQLARRWVEAHELRGRTVVEIGCGKGEFLEMMLREGVARGVGIDPGVRVERTDPALHDRVDWIPARYSAATSPHGDAIVCRHTLEHIGPVAEFTRAIRRSLPEGSSTPVLFELPETMRVLREVAFWDVYYEHCTYFTAGSLTRLFTRTGFDVVDVATDFDDQYLLLTARPSRTAVGADLTGAADDRAEVQEAVRHFAAGFAARVEAWRQRLGAVREAGGRTVVWGGGSKAVAFLVAVGGDLVDEVVDVNPHKHDRYLAGTGHRVVAPKALACAPPDLVAVMNPVYVDEITGTLAELDLHPEVRAA